MRWEDLTSPDIDRLDRDRTVLVLPVGSVEQHGRHMPLGTDSMLAHGVALKHITRHLLGLFHGQSGGRAYRQVLSEGAPEGDTETSTATACSPVNAGRPVRHSNSTQPSAKTSVRASRPASPRACSGAM